MENQTIYFPFEGLENEYIHVAHEIDLEHIPYIKNNTVKNHTHEFFELTIIMSGFCIHNYKGFGASLIAGDAFITPPHQKHSWYFPSQVSLYVCQFYPFILTPYSTDIMNDLLSIKRYQSLSTQTTNSSSSHEYSLNYQGILHMNTNELHMVTHTLNSMLDEYNKKKYGYSSMLNNYLGNLLISLKRIKEKQFHFQDTNDLIYLRKKEMIGNTLSYIASNYNSQIDFSKMAAKQQLSSNYFRSIFKEITGTTPIEHLNRVRILESLELLRTTDLAIIDVAAKVGIYDANYFTRLFKKYIGYPPNYFRKAF